MGLTYPQYLVMTLLWRAEGSVTMKSVDGTLGLASNTLTPLLKRLDALSLLQRSRDPDDERVVRLELTAKGRAMGARAAHIPQCVADATGLAPDELTALIDTLRTVRDRIITT
ncbi:MAG: MarR family transcriptional regulator [Myxococcota bacterium]